MVNLCKIAVVVAFTCVAVPAFAQSSNGGPVAGEGPGGSGAGQSSAGPSKAGLFHRARKRARHHAM